MTGDKKCKKENLSDFLEERTRLLQPSSVHTATEIATPSWPPSHNRRCQQKTIKDDKP